MGSCVAQIYEPRIEFQKPIFWTIGIQNKDKGNVKIIMLPLLEVNLATPSLCPY